VKTDELDYDFDETLIAERPLEERDAARLLALDRASGSIEHERVRDLPKLAPPSLFVVNDTRVIPARLLGKKSSGGRVELLLIERVTAAPGRERWIAMGRASKGLRTGTAIEIAPGFRAEIVAASEGTIEVDLAAENVASAIAEHGHMPLPPYIRRPDDADDAARYQTIFATKDGAVAAPTAGLHFSARLLEDLVLAGHRIVTITLHVGPGTFAPVRADDLADHPMHAEHYEVPEKTAEAIDSARSEGRPVAAVGTTVVRALESAAEGDRVRAGAGVTRLLITPPYEFKVVNALLTNFHLPRSTLLALVMAFGGGELVKKAYRIAVERRYRFYSYGDAMWIR
jgi:S-adenosylmethionine:tRNA ribosyltransferase-isomerase